MHGIIFLLLVHVLIYLKINILVAGNQSDTFSRQSGKVTFPIPGTASSKEKTLSGLQLNFYISNQIMSI